jgi:transcriptional regulator with XRE-family HTH domain
MDKISKEERLFLKELGERIKTIRKEKGITQVELGHRCDLEKPNMNRLENGGTNPTALTLKKICVALEIDMEELVRGL